MSMNESDVQARVEPTSAQPQPMTPLAPENAAEAKQPPSNGTPANGGTHVVNPKLDIESVKTRAYPFDLDPVVVGLYEDGITYLHAMRKSSFAIEARRERMSEVVRRTLGKQEVTDEATGKTIKADRSKSEGDDMNAVNRYYRDLIVTVSGYELNGEVVNDVDPHATEIDTDLGRKKVIDVIPPAHKLFAANNNYGGDYEVDKAARVSLGSGREWRIIHSIGARTLADGKKSDPLFRIVYIFGEPLDDHVRKFRNSALNTLDVEGVNAGESERHRTVNITTLAELFDAGVKRIEGATIAGQPVNVRDDRQLALIPAPFKKNSMLVFYNRVLADLGN